MRRLTATLLAAAVFTISCGAISAQAAVSSSQLLSLEGQFMCVSCHQPLNQVYSPEAQAEKGTLQQLADKGLPLSQIKSQMASDYGPGVLTKPGNPWIYIVPIVVALLALGLIAYTIPRWRQRSTPAAERPPQPDQGDQERLNRELDAFR
ncbi:MAG: cytochrome c-type biogenesis protein CcmH [Solirubrobacterales bacterium]|nr:cytochrome c-type biogenesis protein CcmH [Solirubrobacterales bacterium]